MGRGATDRGDAVRPLDGRTMLFCVGAQKAGTSWLHRYFDGHPQVHVPQCKEMHYFDNIHGPEAGNFLNRRRANLQRLTRKRAREGGVPAAGGALTFPSVEYSRALVAMHEDDDPAHGRYAALLTDGIGAESVVADITPSYAMVGEDGLRAMLDFAPEAKFLFILRDPVDRAWSAIRMLHQEKPGGPGPVKLAERFLKGELPHIQRRSRYAETVAALDAVVPEEQRLYLFFEEMFEPVQMRRLTDFVGIEARAAEVGQAVREGVKHALPEALAARLRDYLAPEYEAMQARFGAAVPARWMQAEAASDAAPAVTGTAQDEVTWLFCLGAQKAGTTWLYDYLLSHPQVHVPLVKEMHYFNVLWDPKQAGFARQRVDSLEAYYAEEALNAAESGEARQIRAALPGDVDSIESLQALVDMHASDEPDHAAYRRFMLKEAGDAKVVADITPDYCTLGPRAISDMQASFPNSKFLFILRDPVERTWSNIKMHSDWLRDRGHDVDADELLVRVVAGRQQHVMQRSSYQNTVFTMNRFIPEGRRLFLFYETLFSDEAMHQLCDFLGVDFHPGNYGKRVRIGQSSSMGEEQRQALRALTGHIYRPMINTFGDRIPESWDVEAANMSPEDIKDTAIGRRARDFLAELAAERELIEAEAAQAPLVGMTGGT